MTEPLRVLVVCTANICRSPAAEAYLRHHAAERDLPVDVSSSGFLYDGESASEAMAGVMGERGFDLSPHRSRITTCALIDEADLVVTMERRHARELSLKCGPSGIFTLGGAVTALTGIDPTVGDPRERLAVADAGRTAADLLGVGGDEIADPFGKSLRVNRRTADELRDLTAALLDSLFPRVQNPS